MALFVATYRYDADPSVLAQLRPERYEYFAGLEADGHLLASGQLVTGELGDGLLVIEAASEDAARGLLDLDPFMRDGYVARLEVAAWNPTTGSWVNR